MNLADRLRSVVQSGGSAAHPSTAPRDAPPPQRAHADVAGILGGEARAWHGQPYVVIDRTYPPGHRHGHTAVADLAPGADGSWPALSILDPSVHGRRVVFIDLETTGLAGGAGTYPFLVGCGWFEGASFRVRQFLLAGYGAERGLLEEVAALVGGACTLGTYNGKAFDVPLIDMRLLLHRMAAPFGGMPHIDMLHQARRLWPSPGPLACRLTRVEEVVLGFVREGDVPGVEIPSRYFHYVRSGDAGPLRTVLEHNRLDLLSLALLAARAAQLLAGGAGVTRTAGEALGLGRLYQRAGMIAHARACFARASGLEADQLHGDALTRAEALRAYAVLCRRARHHDAAADAWRRILDLQPGSPHLAREASEALAVHYEHRRRDLPAARQFAAQALQFEGTRSRTQAVRHRLARLSRRLGGAAPAPSPLF